MRQKKKGNKIPSWFKKKPSEQDKMLFRRALANYIANHMPADAPFPQANVKTFKAVLP